MALKIKKRSVSLQKNYHKDAAHKAAIIIRWFESPIEKILTQTNTLATRLNNYPIIFK